MPEHPIWLAREANPGSVPTNWPDFTVQEAGRAPRESEYGYVRGLLASTANARKQDSGPTIQGEGRSGVTQMMNEETSAFRHGAKMFLALVTYSMLLSCGTLPTIATSVDYCCQTGTEGIKTFRVEFENMPEFLKPMLRDEASIVLATKNLDYVEGDAHAVLHMKFINRTLDTVEEAHDEAWETIAPGGGVRFIAEVKIELRDSVTGERLWAGTMGRVHNVYEGSYMHDAPARVAIRNAFMTIFNDFPSLRDQKDE